MCILFLLLLGRVITLVVKEWVLRRAESSRYYAVGKRHLPCWWNRMTLYCLLLAPHWIQVITWTWPLKCNHRNVTNVILVELWIWFWFKYCRSGGHCMLNIFRSKDKKKSVPASTTSRILDKTFKLTVKTNKYCPNIGTLLKKSISQADSDRINLY